MTAFTRADRVAGHVQRVLSEILIRKIKDPRLKNTTITGVKMSNDLKFARIYFVTIGGEKGKEDALAGFDKAFGYLKRSLAEQLGLRYMPDIRFYYDASLEYGSRIEKLIQDLKSDSQ